MMGRTFAVVRGRRRHHRHQGRRPSCRWRCLLTAAPLTEVRLRTSVALGDRLAAYPTDLTPPCRLDRVAVPGAELAPELEVYPPGEHPYRSLPRPWLRRRREPHCSSTGSLAPTAAYRSPACSSRASCGRVAASSAADAALADQRLLAPVTAARTGLRACAARRAGPDPGRIPHERLAAPVDPTSSSPWSTDCSTVWFGDVRVISALMGRARSTSARKRRQHTGPRRPHGRKIMTSGRTRCHLRWTSCSSKGAPLTLLPETEVGGGVTLPGVICACG